MDWRRTLLLVLAALGFIFSRMDEPVAGRELLGLKSLFPIGDARPIQSAGWEGLALPYRFRRPVLKIDLALAKGQIIWEGRKLCYDRYTFVLCEEELSRWRSYLPA